MKNALLVGLLLALGGCASHSCDEPGSACRAERLLYQNDLLQAKILIAQADEDGYELAQALLERSARLDKRGETEFYQALLLIRQGPQQEEVLNLLERAADKGHPHAVAMLYRIYQQPFLIGEQQPEKAEAYRRAYAGLDVAKSGYPPFEKALEVVSQLLEPPPEAELPAPCPSHCR